MIQKLRNSQKMGYLVKSVRDGQLSGHLAIARSLVEAVDMVFSSNPTLNIVGVDALNAEFVYVDTDDQGQIILDGPSKLIRAGKGN